MKNKGARRGDQGAVGQTYNHGHINGNEDAGQLTRGQHFELDLGLDIHSRIALRGAPTGEVAPR